MGSLIFADAKCPCCGGICGNGGHGNTFYCPSCGWNGVIEMSTDDVKAMEEFIREHLERNKEPTSNVATCDWYEPFSGACCNGDSPHRADFRDANQCCPAWAPKGERGAAICHRDRPTAAPASGRSLPRRAAYTII